MTFFVYIIYSKTLNKYYVGQTTNVENRILQHNDFLNTNWTQRAIDWQVKVIMKCKSISHAMKLERFIKKQKSRKFIEKVILDLKIQNEIIRAHDC